jgi:cell fate (sporulation/competence/biofilm development) regulator YlbF (YheA/YmcA/DUF963 family)
MDKILETAREIGLLIRETDIFKRYSRAGQDLNADKASSDILDRLYTLTSEIDARNKMGDIIEEFEKQELESLKDRVSGSPLILNFLKAEKEYADLLIRIQEELKSNE